MRHKAVTATPPPHTHTHAFAQVERERQTLAAAEEERSVVARYRGPLLEATADLEARIYHIATLSGAWGPGRKSARVCLCRVKCAVCRGTLRSAADINGCRQS